MLSYFASLLRSAVVLAIVAVPLAPHANAETVRIGGTGAGLAAMQSLGDSLMAADPTVRVVVLPSLGTPGGLRALAAREIDVAITVRPLTEQEQAKGLQETVCVRSALVFASTHADPVGLTRAGLPRLFADEAPTWPDGTPLKIILRSRASSEYVYLAKIIPGIAAAIETAHRRPGMPIASTDQENADLAQRAVGSLAITTLLQIRAERLRLRPLAIDGVFPDLASLSDKTYPFLFNLCAVLRADDAGVARKFVAHMASPAGLALLRGFDAVPVE